MTAASSKAWGIALKNCARMKIEPATMRSWENQAVPGVDPTQFGDEHVRWHQA